MSSRTRTRATQRKSYRESESESDDEDSNVEDSSEDSEPSSPPPTRRRTLKRKSPPQSESQSSTRTRRKKARVSYAEDFSDVGASDFSSDEPEEDYDDDVGGVQIQSPKKRTTTTTTTRHGAKKNGVSPRKATPRKAPQRRARPAPTLPSRGKKAVVSAPKETVPYVTDGINPPWINLPYEVLCDIMVYASRPLFDERNNPCPSISWLLKTALVCKTFTEPALAALYQCPPLTSAIKPHAFLASLSQASPNAPINFKPKVKRLELEVRSALAYSAGTAFGAFDIGTLVQHLPQLREIDIWSIYDSPNFRHGRHAAKQWAYPDTLFAALVNGGQKLRSFHWNGRLFGKMGEDLFATYTWVKGIHATPPFQSLRGLTMTNIGGDSEARIILFEPITTPAKAPSATQLLREAAREEKKLDIKKQDELLAQALADLPHLQALDFHQCCIVDGEWLSLLPRTLTSLGITECEMINTDGLQAFLTTHGVHLKTLVLNHNPALAISFLTTLKETCPRLETFAMDLTYYSKHIATGVREPEYFDLLLPDERPTWPTTLQSIDMFHLRQWTSKAADLFFGSLIESAESLPDLRRLTLVVSLNISWRERATFRDLWIEKLNRVFLRKAAPPNPYWMSLRGMREWKQKQNMRTLSHIAVPSATNKTIANGNETSHFTSNEPPKRTLRPRKSTISDDDEKEEEADLARLSLHEEMMQILEKHIQGVCDVVDIRIDNLRPSENQFHESDFLDSEVSGDEDWDENRGDADDDELFRRGKGRRGRRGGYAW